MKISPTIGIECRGNIISESDFEQYNIISTREAIEEYFSKYGYSFIAPFDLEQNLVIVQDKNFEVSMLLGMFYKSFRVINYKTGEIVNSRITSDGFNYNQATILSFLYRISRYGKKSRLINSDNDEVVLEADLITFLSANEVFFRKYNIDYIMKLETLETYPLIKREYNVYQGPNPEKFIDFRNGMYYQNQRCIFPVDISRADVDYLIHTFPFGEKKDRLFFLLDNPIRYGIRYEDSEVSEIWFDTIEERDAAYSGIQGQVLNAFNQEKQKTKYQKNKVTDN